MRKLAFLLLPLLFIYGCDVNPVTGENELALISENEEISIGQKITLPAAKCRVGTTP